MPTTRQDPIEIAREALAAGRLKDPVNAPIVEDVERRFGVNLYRAISLSTPHASSSTKKKKGAPRAN